jgi:trehalose synthase
MADAGIDLSRPVLVQVSRFDPWKDPLGVIQVYRLVKAELPGVQLALIGAMAGDDPEGWEQLDRVEEESANDPDMYVFTNLGGVGSMEVNVFQRGSDVVIQKSLREGFGLVVAEALWKGKPVVAGMTITRLRCATSWRSGEPDDGVSQPCHALAGCTPFGEEG